MENNNIGEAAWEGADQPNDWQYAESKENQWDQGTDEYNSFDLRSAEANGYGTELDQYIAKSNDDEDGDSDDEEATMDDWGEVDPKGGDAPTAPGSAV